jgi:hypothetical protein
LPNAFAVPETLAGDLIEQHAVGRSGRWLWRQVLMAVVISTFREVCARKRPALLAVIVGWAVLVLFVGAFETLHTQLTVGALISAKLWWWQYVGIPLEPWTTYALAVASGIASGWTVARLARRSGSHFVLAFLASYVLPSFGWIYWFAQRVLHDPHIYSSDEWAVVTSQYAGSDGHLAPGDLA